MHTIALHVLDSSFFFWLIVFSISSAPMAFSLAVRRREFDCTTHWRVFVHVLSAFKHNLSASSNSIARSAFNCLISLCIRSRVSSSNCRLFPLVSRAASSFCLSKYSEYRSRDCFTDFSRSFDTATFSIPPTWCRWSLIDRLAIKVFSDKFWVVTCLFWLKLLSTDAWPCESKKRVFKTDQTFYKSFLRSIASK